ncbi:HK97 family phage prohead protease [Bythopirellula polymerisocia]|uniref:Caudovirus prohead protease n=1 Tax=Bythopirellula polymerisocia TaxID=2528003 RepID=A0A5C6CAD5_9BACT|nr:HK97 family phage prohead protease [Bythopirellula polymerisocia]TWU20907.1 Caudovirus prohead protease [Bythopirellula polymerisocia]
MPEQSTTETMQILHLPASITCERRQGSSTLNPNNRLAGSSSAATLQDDSMIVRATVATERRCLVFDRSTGQVIEEILLAEGLRLPENQQVPLLDNHLRHSIANQVGSARSFARRGSEWVATMHLTPGLAAAEDAYRMIMNGDLTDCSIGYVVTKSTWIAPHQSGGLNNRNWKAGKYGLRLGIEYHIQELSLTSIGADADAKIKAAEKQTPPVAGASYFAKASSDTSFFAK